MNNDKAQVAERKIRLISVYRRLGVFLVPHRTRFVISLLAMALYGATDGAVPFVIRSVLDDVFGRQDHEMLYLLTALLIAFAVLRGFFNFYQHFLIAQVGHRIVRDLRNAINAHLLKLSPSFFSQNPSGTLISRVTNDSLLVRSALTDAVATVLRDTVRIVALVIAAIMLDPWLASIALLGIPLAFWPVIRFGKRVRKLSRVGQGQLGGLTSLLQESVLGVKVVQAFGMEKYEEQRFQRENQNITTTYEKAEKYGALAAPTNEFFASIAIAGVIFYGGTMVFKGIRSQGDFVAFLTALFLLYEPVKKLSRVNNIVQQGMAAADRIFELLDTESEVKEKPNAVELPASVERIEFQNVGFRYAPRASGKPSSLTGGQSGENNEREWAVREVSLVVEEGQTVAVVGMSGGGKSTLASLLLRFYDPQEGRILISGTDIRDVTLQSLRSRIALVSQQTFLFNDTVYANIAYGCANSSEEAVREAARAAYADSFIGRLPHGYETIIGEQGTTLSGGERSRIAIARALLKNAPILLLDEATAALDSESEELVQQAINRLMNNRTVIVIAHRLATVRNASRIAVLSDGSLVEFGTHDELLKKNGEFAKFYNLQFARPEENKEIAVND